MAVPSAPSPALSAVAGAALLEADAPRVGGAARRVVAAPTPAFFLRHHPRCWEVVDLDVTVEGTKLKGAFWLPTVMKMPVVVGTLGFRTRNRGEPEEATHEQALRIAREQGWVVLDDEEAVPSSCLPAGVPAGPYRRRIACQDPMTQTVGHVYLEAWSVPVESFPGDPLRTSFDRKAYDAWRAWLAMTGRVPPPRPLVKAELQRQLRQRIDRAETLGLPEHLVKRRVDAATAAANAADNAKVPSEPKRKAADESAGGAS